MVEFYLLITLSRLLSVAAEARIKILISSRIELTTLCVCVCVFSSHLFWTSSLYVPAGVTQEEGYTGFLVHLSFALNAFIFLAGRILPILSLVDRELEFYVLTI